MKKDTTNDMTVGSPVSLIIKFMIPMCLGNLFQQFYNIADSIVAGKFIGVNALAAIGSTGSLMFFVTGWLNGLSSGFAIIVAQMFGAKKFDRMRHYVAMSIYLMAAFSIVMTIGFSLANKPILHLMNSPEEVFGDVTAYMGIIYAGLIITGAYNALAAFLRALGDSKSPLYFLIISAVINVILDVVFIVVFGMGVEGCGYATVIAQGISAVCCLIYIVKRFPILHLERKDFEICWDSFGRLLKLGICHSIYSLRCNHSNLCRSEQGRRKNGSCETGSPLHADDGPGMERFCYVPDVFLRKISDISFRRSIGTGRSKCVCYLFPDSILGISVSRKYFPLSKYSAGNGIWTCTNAWRGI